MSRALANHLRVLDYLRAYQARDIAAVAALLADDVQLRDWNICVQGKAAVLDETLKNFRTGGALTIVPLKVYAGEDAVAVELQILVGGTVDLRVVDAIEVGHDGRLRAIRAYKGQPEPPRAGQVRVVPLCTLPQHTALVAGWLQQEWPAWYGPGGAGHAQADAERYAATALAAPCGLLALVGDTPLGFGALKTEPFPTHPGLGPWVGAGVVLPAHRGQGLGGQLLQALAAAARTLGHPHAYCATATANSLLQRSGWTALATVLHDGQPHTVFASPAEPQD